MKFAVIKTGGKQYRVKEGDTVTVEKLAAAEDKPVVFDRVLMAVDGDQLTLGAPTIVGAKVEAQLLNHGRAKKVTIFKYKPKTRYRVKRGHRQPYSRVKIARIDF